MKFSVCVPGKAENHTIVKMKKPVGLCYNRYKAIAFYSFHFIPLYRVVWSLFSIKNLKGLGNDFFF